METTPQAMAQLKEFGVSIYAARAYLALLELGVAEARAVSDLASIPSAKVYGALVQLQKRGLAEVTPGKPRKYAPVPIASFLDRQLQEQEERVAELRTRADAIAELFPQGAGASAPERPQTVTIEGKRNIMQHLRETCQSAEVSIHAMLSPILRSDLALRRPFEEAANRGVDVRLAEDAFGADPAVADSGSLLATFDDRAALLIRLRRGGPRREGHSSTAILTTDAGFVLPLRRLLATSGDARRGPPAPTAAAAGSHARVDLPTFERFVKEQAVFTPREACLVVHVAEAKELERDRLWMAIRGAARARVLLSPATPRPADPELAALLPPGVEAKFLPRASPVAFAVIDGDRALFVSPARPTRDRVDEALYGVSADLAIVRAFEAQFEANWAIAAPLVRPRADVPSDR